jgi:protein-disulfide isomerase
MNAILKTIINMIITSIFTLLLFVIIVHFAPVSISNLFLNPIAVVKGLQHAQEVEYKKSQQKSEKNFKKVLKNNKESIFDQNAPYIGNKDAKVQVVIFFDYKCGYCAALENTVANVMKDKKYSENVKFIIRDLPILSPTSKTLAVAGLKAFNAKPEAFAKVHEALFKTDGGDQVIKSTVKLITGVEIDLNPTSDEEQVIASNISLAQEIGIQGTPAIVIGDELIGGLISEDQLKSKLDKQLKK